MSRINEGLRPATDGQVALAARLLAEMNSRSFLQLRAWAAGSRPPPETEHVRLRLLAVIERFVAGGQVTPEVLRAHLSPRMAEPLADDLAGASGQEALRQIAAQLAMVLLVERLPTTLQEWFEGLRPRLLRGAPQIVPWLLKSLAAVRASDFMASWGLAISEVHALQIEPMLRAQREAVESGVKVFYGRLRSPEAIDVIGLADAALDDFEDLTRSLSEMKDRVLPSTGQA